MKEGAQARSVSRGRVETKDKTINPKAEAQALHVITQKEISFSDAYSALLRRPRESCAA